MAKTLEQLEAEFTVIRSHICELRSRVDDLQSDARDLYESATPDTTEEADASNLFDELAALSDILASWEND